MTAYELASLHTQIGDNINAQLSNWLAIVSLYLGAGYLLAHRLSLLSAIALSTIFLVILGGWTVQLLRAMQNWVGVSNEIRKLSEKSSGLEWHQAALVPPDTLAFFPVGGTITLWIIILAALSFFFSSRRQNLKTQPRAQ